MKHYLVIVFLVSSICSEAQDILEKINSSQNEYGMAFVGEDLIVFSRDKKLMQISKSGNEWTDAESVPFSIDWNDEYPSFDPESNRLYFSSNRPRPGTTEKLARNDLWYAVWQDDEWSDPVHLSDPFSTEGIDSGGFCVGKDIYFHSDRAGSGMDDVDIYVCEGGGGPEKLPISSDLVDGEVFLFANGSKMLFMSAGHGAVGKSDIFISSKKLNFWSPPVPVDTTGQVNTSDWELAPCLSTDGKWLYFSRYGSEGSDILRVEVARLSSAADFE